MLWSDSSLDLNHANATDRDAQSTSSGHVQNKKIYGILFQNLIWRLRNNYYWKRSEKTLRRHVSRKRFRHSCVGCCKHSHRRFTKKESIWSKIWIVYAQNLRLCHRLHLCGWCRSERTNILHSMCFFDEVVERIKDSTNQWNGSLKVNRGTMRLEKYFANLISFIFKTTGEC